MQTTGANIEDDTLLAMTVANAAAASDTGWEDGTAVAPDPV